MSGTTSGRQLILQPPGPMLPAAPTVAPQYNLAGVPQGPLQTPPDTMMTDGQYDPEKPQKVAIYNQLKALLQNSPYMMQNDPIALQDFQFGLPSITNNHLAADRINQVMAEGKTIANQEGVSWAQGAQEAAKDAVKPSNSQPDIYTGRRAGAIPPPSANINSPEPTENDAIAKSSDIFDTELKQQTDQLDKMKQQTDQFSTFLDGIIKSSKSPSSTPATPTPKNSSSAGRGSADTDPAKNPPAPITVRTQNLKRMAARLAHEGRGEDSVLAHLNSREMHILKLFGGSGKKNPKTGLIEFDDTGDDGGDSGGGGLGGDAGGSASGDPSGGGYGSGASSHDTSGAISGAGLGGGGTDPGAGYGGSIFGGAGTATNAPAPAAVSSAPASPATPSFPTAAGQPSGLSTTGADTTPLNSPMTPVTDPHSTSSLGGAALGIASPVAGLVSGLSAGISPLGGITSGLLGGGGLIGLIHSAINGTEANPSDVMGLMAGTSPVLGLGYAVTRGLEALGVEPTGAPASEKEQDLGGQAKIGTGTPAIGDGRFVPVSAST